MIKSMTGYGRFESSTPEKEISVEIRSVNHRFFEYSLKIPKIYSFLEEKIKSYIQSRVFRGKVDVFITIYTTNTPGVNVQVNHALAESYINALSELADIYQIKSDISAIQISRYPDVLLVTKDEEDEEKAFAELVPSLEGALTAFIKTREFEGRKLRADILDRIDAILQKVDIIEKRSPEIVSEYYNRLKSRLEEVLSDTQANEQRIVTEAALFADKTAVSEETVRIKSHLSQISELLQADEPVGRKLDFIVQELNREANTIGSKSQNIEITRLVVDIKSEIEKIREQVQNIE